MNRPVRFPRALWTSAIAIAVLCAAAPWWLPGLGTFLVRGDPPRKADAALVLGGDFYGNRILDAAELARQGLVPKVFVSGPLGFYGFHENELAVPYAVRKGYPESLFIGLPHDATSTREEARIVIPELRRRGVHVLDIITSDFHSRRAARVFRSVAPDMEIAMVTVPTPRFDPHHWWTDREGRKTVFAEWTKTVADWMGGL